MDLYYDAQQRYKDLIQTMMKLFVCYVNKTRSRLLTLYYKFYNSYTIIRPRKNLEKHYLKKIKNETFDKISYITLLVC